MLTECDLLGERSLSVSPSLLLQSWRSLSPLWAFRKSIDGSGWKLFSLLKIRVNLICCYSVFGKAELRLLACGWFANSVSGLILQGVTERNISLQPLRNRKLSILLSEEQA